MRMNDGVADPQGRFWAGSMAYEATEDAGSLYRMDRDGRVTRILRDITVPNGPAFTADGTVMYLADSARGLVRRYPVDPVTGDVGEPVPHITFSTGSPDGMTTDAEGGLWIAVWGVGQAHRYHPGGTLDRIVNCLPPSPPGSASAVPTAAPSSSPAPASACPGRARWTAPSSRSASTYPGRRQRRTARSAPRARPPRTPTPAIPQSVPTHRRTHHEHPLDLRPGPVVCVGETMAALAPEPLGPLDDADLLRVDIAGAESNVALYLADHGIPTRWLSAVGDDPFGRRVRDRIAAGGVDVEGVHDRPDRPPDCS